MSVSIAIDQERNRADKLEGMTITAVVVAVHGGGGM